MTDQPKGSQRKRQFWLKFAAGLLFALVALVAMYGWAYATFVRRRTINFEGTVYIRFRVHPPEILPVSLEVPFAQIFRPGCYADAALHGYEITR